MGRFEHLFSDWQAGDIGEKEFTDLKKMLAERKNQNSLYEELRFTSAIQQVLTALGPVPDTGSPEIDGRNRPFHSDRHYIRSRGKRSGSGRFITALAAAAVLVLGVFFGYRYLQENRPLREHESPARTSQPLPEQNIPKPVGTLTACFGDVRVERKGETVAFQPELELLEGDILNTGADGLCRMRIYDTITVALNTGTRVSMGLPGKERGRGFAVDSGEIFLDAGKQDIPFTIELGTFQTVITGTRLFSRVSEEEQNVSLLEGSVLIKHGNNQEQVLTGRGTALYMNGKLKLRDRLVFSRIDWLKNLGFEGTGDFYMDPDYDDYRSYGKGSWTVTRTEDGYQVFQKSPDSVLTGIMIGEPFLKEGIFSGQMLFPSDKKVQHPKGSVIIKPKKTVRRALNIPKARKDESWVALVLYYNKGKKKSSFSFDPNYITTETKGIWIDFRLRFKITKEDRLITSAFLKTGDAPEERLDLDRGFGKMVKQRKLCNVGIVTNKCRIILRNLRIYPEPDKEKTGE